MFNEYGYLPPGIHLFTLDQMRDAFGGFKSTNQRPRLYGKFLELVDEAKRFDFIRYFVIDGSFVTDKSDPSDIDLLIVVDQGVLSRLDSSMINPYEYNILSSRMLKKRFLFDVFVVPEHSQSLINYMNFFSRIKNSDLDIKKGVVRLNLK